MKHSATRQILLLVLLICSVGQINAQLLWKVTRPTSSHESYLFGTHHLAPISVIDNTAGLSEALSKVDAVIGEIDIAEAQTPQMQMVMQKYMAAPADSTLRTLLSPQQLDSVVSVVTKYCGPQFANQAIDRLSPAAVGTILGVRQASLAFPDHNPLEQLDSELQNRARRLGKIVKGFETVEFQCSRLLGAPIARQTKALMTAIRNDAQFASQATALTEAYLSGDLDRLLQLMANPVTGLSEQEADRLLYSRNADWVDFLMGALPAMSVLVVVGAGHLPGEKGLISRLRQHGYNVEPVNSSK